jgi:aryl hydrocarbon receptor nuclear translocator-like protein 1
MVIISVGRLVDTNKNCFVQSNFKEKKTCDENEVHTNPKSPGSNKTLNENLQRNFQFTSRHAMDGKYSFVDQRATLVLGFLPQELLGTNMYEYFKPKDIASLAESHKGINNTLFSLISSILIRLSTPDALQSNHSVTTPIYGLRTKHNGFISVQSEWKSFRNPWTKEMEFLIAKNNVIFSDLDGFDEQEINENNFDFFNQCMFQSGRIKCVAKYAEIYFHFLANGHHEIQRMINTHIEASKIGSQIAEQVLDHQRRMGESSGN